LPVDRWADVARKGDFGAEYLRRPSLDLDLEARIGKAGDLHDGRFGCASVPSNLA
jgi:hypothetical protein